MIRFHATLQRNNMKIEFLKIIDWTCIKINADTIKEFKAALSDVTSKYKVTIDMLITPAEKYYHDAITFAHIPEGINYKKYAAFLTVIST